MQTDHRQVELERARQRREYAAPGSPDWDAASEAVLELEARDPAPLAEQLRRKLFHVEVQPAA
jgi:hypothetical protein